MTWANPFGKGFLGIQEITMKETTAAALDLFDNTLDDEWDEITSPGTTLPEPRTLSECWELYRDTNRSHTDLSDQEIVAMLQSLVDAHNALIEIDEDYYAMTIDSLENRYFGYRDLALIAKARDIKDYPVL
jgi:hypothetical protein